MGRSSWEREQAIAERANEQVMTHHTVALDGAVWSVWRCTRCGRELGKFGAGMPVAVADCIPRRWSDGAA